MYFYEKQLIRNGRLKFLKSSETTLNGLKKQRHTAVYCNTTLDIQIPFYSQIKRYFLKPGSATQIVCFDVEFCSSLLFELKHLIISSMNASSPNTCFKI